MARQPLVFQCLLIIEASRWHLETPHLVGLLWTSDRPDAWISTRQHTIVTGERHPCPERFRTQQQATEDPHLRTHGHQYRRCRNLARKILKLLFTSRKIAVSIPNGVIGIFNWLNPSGRTVVLGSTLPVTEMSTRNISWRVNASVA